MTPQTAFENLRNCQRQLDMDGCEVGVSRQALDEVLAEYEALLAELKLAREWLLTLQTGRGIEAREALAPRLAAIDAVIAKAEGGAS